MLLYILLYFLSKLRVMDDVKINLEFGEVHALVNDVSFIGLDMSSESCFRKPT